MTKKLLIMMPLILCLSGGLFSVELGLIGGPISNPSHFTYGINSSTGFFVPLISLELELYKKTGTEAPEMANAISAALKFRPKFGKLWPYAVVGIGTEFKRINLDFDEYETFTFVGAGIHYHLMAVISIRGDIRFLNFSDYNRTRISGGLFFHF